MPTGHVLVWHFLHMTHPMATIGAVAREKPSAPNRAAMTMSRSVFSWPSACRNTRPRRPLATSACWTSARPVSNGDPA